MLEKTCYDCKYGKHNNGTCSSREGIMLNPRIKFECKFEGKYIFKIPIGCKNHEPQEE